jgi:hypothetical protein
MYLESSFAFFVFKYTVALWKPCPHLSMDDHQKRFIYRILTLHDFLSVWLVADK